MSNFAFRLNVGLVINSKLLNKYNNCVYCFRKFGAKTGVKIGLNSNTLAQEIQSNFSRVKAGSFIQTKPVLSSNQYLIDNPLKSYLSKHIPIDVLKSFEDDLIKFGEAVASNIHSLGLECEKNPPKLVQQNAWGERVDDLQTCEAWKKMKEISAKEGLISIAYEKKYGEWSRLYQMVKLYLFAPSSGLYSCPLAMTDGAAETINNLSKTNAALFRKAYEHLISRNPTDFWTSGQWMTEKRGGSDVANGTETLAVEQSDGSYSLYGYKFFSSATDSDMCLTLARVVDQNGETIDGTNGLTLFYLETRNSGGELNGIQIKRLKDKLGTRQLPTAELLLDGTIALRMSEIGKGISAISTMLSVTRLHNACASVAGMRRIINLAVNYSHQRVAFGQPISRYPLHVQTLARMELETRGALVLFLETAKLLGRIDCDIATDTEKLVFRIITPVLKLYSAKQAMKVVSEGLECFGGQGYMEDTGIPLALRDAQVLPIWEGTTNVLSLDVIRSLAKTKGAVLVALSKDISDRLDACTDPRLQTAKRNVVTAVESITKFVIENPDKLIVAARDLSFSIARTYIGALLVDEANNSPSLQDLVAANRWCKEKRLSLVNDLDKYDKSAITDDYNLVME